MAATPWLHDLTCAVSAPTQLWCGPDGEIDGARGVEGLWHGDVRVLRSARLTADGLAATAILNCSEGGRAFTVGVVEGHRVERRRTVTAGLLREEISLPAGGARAVQVVVTTDQAAMDVVRGGRGTTRTTPDASRFRTDGEITAVGDELRISWTGEHVEGWWEISAHDESAVVVAAAPADWSLTSRDPRLDRWVQQALADLQGLRMAPAEDPDDVFVAAGAPWFFTLFGRDSLWTARMLLPLGWELAASTLRALATRQGTRHDPATAEEPGKILHELRSGAATHGDVVLPPLYYGTVDATSLWVCLLHEAWRAGMPQEQVRKLVPHLETALEWHLSHGGEFLRYVDQSGRGLSNQGWKDSDDSVQWRDGTLADGPIALCEVQAYAHQAALAGAELLEQFHRPAEHLRSWAHGLRARFRTEFWVHPHGDVTADSFPAIALDGEGRAVDSLTSNLGHLLGTGLLDDQESRIVADHLASPELASGFGLRTLATTARGFDPASYHCGAVWAHDTAIAVIALAREGFETQARVLFDGLLTAAESFSYRMPELHCGDPRSGFPQPVPYPTACRPQAWSAAAAIALAGNFG